MLLLPGNAKNLISTLGDSAPDSFGWLLTSKRSMTIAGINSWRYAVDNECFTRPFSEARYRALLQRLIAVHGTESCLFATAPDVVGNARATLQLSAAWLPAIRELGMPVALVAQDGLEEQAIPWSEFDVLFIGGSTAWKLGIAAADIMNEARTRGKWLHVGRVNSVYRASRLRIQPDSIDGTAWAKHPTYYAKEWSRWLQNGKPYHLHLGI